MSTPIEGVKIEWTCPEYDWDEFRIYKSDEPFGPDDLPALYDTVGPHLRSYLDTDVTSAEAYYLAVPVLGGVEYPYGGAVKRSVFDEVVPIGTPILGGWYIGNVTVTDEPEPIYPKDRRGVYAVIMRDVEVANTTNFGNILLSTPDLTIPRTSSHTDAVRNTRILERYAAGVGVRVNPSPFLEGMRRNYPEWEALASLGMLDLVYANREKLPESVVGSGGYVISSTAFSPTSATLRARRLNSTATTTRSYITSLSDRVALVKMIRLPDA